MNDFDYQVTIASNGVILYEDINIEIDGVMTVEPKAHVFESCEKLSRFLMEKTWIRPVRQKRKAKAKPVLEVVQ